MSRIRHIAITTQEPRAVADFFVRVFELRELRARPDGAVYLSDGHINLAVLPPKRADVPDVGPGGPGWEGYHHIGFTPRSLARVRGRLQEAGAVCLVGDLDAHEYAASLGDAFFEEKWASPDGDLVIDLGRWGV